MPPVVAGDYHRRKKTRYRGLLLKQQDEQLLDLRFFIDHMLACFRVVLPGFHFLRMQTLVFGCRVEVTGTGT